MTGLWSRITRSNFLIRLRSWEYWPFGVIQFPLFFYYPWLSLKAGSFTFFSGSNPGIIMGGMFGESKHDVLCKIPHELIPKTFLVCRPVSAEEVGKLIDVQGFRYPVIFKPDIGERGYMVKRINGPADVHAYLHKMPFDFIIQELVDLPVEAGVFYLRYPDEDRGKVISVVLKEMLHVVGDGSSTLQELILNNDRAKLQWKKLSETYRDRLTEVLPPGTRLEIVSIGNHCLGTMFINGNHLISEKMHAAYDAISKQIDGFYFGRFDLRCNSTDDLVAGNVKILELNGCGAEPAHIYDPGFSLLKAVSTLIAHWRAIFDIAQQNKKRGYKYLPLRDAVRYYQTFKSKIR